MEQACILLPKEPSCLPFNTVCSSSTGQKKGDPTFHGFCKLHWFSVHKWVQFQPLTIMHKEVHSHTYTFLAIKFKWRIAWPSPCTFCLRTRGQPEIRLFSASTSFLVLPYLLGASLKLFFCVLWLSSLLPDSNVNSIENKVTPISFII